MRQNPTPGTRRCVVCVIAFFALMPLTATAYIDPNTGGMLFQMFAPLVAMVTGALLFARDYLRGLLRRFIGLFRRGAPPASAPPQKPES